MAAIVTFLLTNQLAQAGLVTGFLTMWVFLKIRKAKREAMAAAAARERHEASNAALKKKQGADKIAAKSPGKARTRKRLKSGEF